MTKKIENDKVQSLDQEQRRNLTKIKIGFYLLIFACVIIILLFHIIFSNPLILILSGVTALIVLYFEINLEKEDSAVIKGQNK